MAVVMFRRVGVRVLVSMDMSVLVSVRVLVRVRHPVVLVHMRMAVLMRMGVLVLVSMCMDVSRPRPVLMSMVGAVVMPVPIAMTVVMIVSVVCHEGNSRPANAQGLSGRSTTSAPSWTSTTTVGWSSQTPGEVSFRPVSMSNPTS
ncbi:hypothetical protein WA016_00362 [Myxococcus stipitatus]